MVWILLVCTGKYLTTSRRPAFRTAEQSGPIRPTTNADCVMFVTRTEEAKPRGGFGSLHWRTERYQSARTTHDGKGHESSIRGNLAESGTYSQRGTDAVVEAKMVIFVFCVSSGLLWRARAQ